MLGEIGRDAVLHSCGGLLRSAGSGKIGLGLLHHDVVHLIWRVRAAQTRAQQFGQLLRVGLGHEPAPDGRVRAAVELALQQWKILCQLLSLRAQHKAQELQRALGVALGRGEENRAARVQPAPGARLVHGKAHEGVVAKLLQGAGKPKAAAQRIAVQQTQVLHRDRRIVRALLHAELQQRREFPVCKVAAVPLPVYEAARGVAKHTLEKLRAAHPLVEHGGPLAQCGGVLPRLVHGEALLIADLAGGGEEGPDRKARRQAVHASLAFQRLVHAGDELIPELIEQRPELHEYGGALHSRRVYARGRHEIRTLARAELHSQLVRRLVQVRAVFVLSDLHPVFAAAGVEQVCKLPGLY